MFDWTEESAKQVLQEVGLRSSTDPEFRKLCLSNPSEAIAAVNETPLPPNFKVRFVENQGVNMTVVLPDPVTSDELQDTELEKVAGGVDTFRFRTLRSDWNQLSWMQVADSGGGPIRRSRGP